MTHSTDTAAAAAEKHANPLVVARRQIAAVRSRAEQPSDGGSTGRSDGND